MDEVLRNIYYETFKLIINRPEFNLCIYLKKRSYSVETIGKLRLRKATLLLKSLLNIIYRKKCNCTHKLYNSKK